MTITNSSVRIRFGFGASLRVLFYFIHFSVEVQLTCQLVLASRFIV